MTSDQLLDVISDLESAGTYSEEIPAILAKLGYEVHRDEYSYLPGRTEWHIGAEPAPPTEADLEAALRRQSKPAVSLHMLDEAIRLGYRQIVADLAKESPLFRLLK